MPLNRQAPVLQKNSKDLLIFKVRSFSCAGGDCWERLQGQNTGASWLLQLVLEVHSLHPQAPSHPCRVLFISSSFGLISPWSFAYLNHLKTCLKLLNTYFFPPKIVYSLNSLLGFN